MNAAARLVCHYGRLTPVSCLPCDLLHRLNVSEWVGYKLWLLVFKAVHGTTPEYLWALPIKRWRRCSFSTPLGSTECSRGSTFEDKLWWSSICSRRASIRNRLPVIWHSSEFQEQIESSLLLMDHFFFFSIHLERRRPWIGLHVTALKKSEINVLLLLLLKSGVDSQINCDNLRKLVRFGMCKILDKSDVFLLNCSNLLRGPLSGHSVVMQFFKMCNKFRYNSIISQVHVMSHCYAEWFLSWIGNPQRFPREISGQFRTTTQNLPVNHQMRLCRVITVIVTFCYVWLRVF